LDWLIKDPQNGVWYCSPIAMSRRHCVFICATVCLRHCVFAPLCVRATVYLRHCVFAPLCVCATVCLRHCVFAPLCVCATACSRHCVFAPLRVCATVCLRHCVFAPLCVCAAGHNSFSLVWITKASSPIAMSRRHCVFVQQVIIVLV